MKTKAKFLEEILQYKPYNTELIGRAYDKAKELHDGQLRKSGEPYLVHPIAVAIILAQLGMDDETLVAGMLHDTVEDTPYTREQLVEDFGEDIALLVDGVTKLGNLKVDSKEQAQAENLRKMFLAMSKDIRVLIIKLADRLHNMRTIEFMTPAKIIEKSRETLDIYAPLAGRLGIYTVKFELENISLKYLHPQEYADLEKRVNAKKQQREEMIQKVIAEIKEALDGMHMKYDIMGRSKQLYSIYKKMTVQHKQLDEIFDLVAVRVIVETVRDCYAVLGQVHTMWKPIPGRFKDYIAMPKPNMYQSLHTTVLGDNGVPFEIQIRTYEMHRVAEYGIAAHWKYKEGNTSGNQNKEEMKLAWLRQAIEWQKDLQDPKDFLDTLKMDLFSSQVFVFTPKGEVIDLPAGSTPLDFAFKIHTDVGCHCVGAKVNGKMVTIDHPLSSGDIVEIVTNPNSSGPSVDWLKIVKSSTAKNKIRSWLKKQTNGDDVNRGREALDKYIRKKGYEPSAVTKTQFLNLAMKKMNFVTLDEAYKQLAQGGSLVSRFAKILFEQYDQDQQREQEKKRAKEEALLKAAAKSDVRKKKKRKDAGIIVKGMDGLMVRVAHCCNPVPGDDIVGFITKGRGVSVHRKDCTNITSMPESERARFIEVEWKKDEPEDQMYQAGITVIFNDRKGMFSDVSRVCDEMDVNIERVNGRVDKDGRMRLMLSLSIRDINQVEKIMGKMRKIPDVISTYRSGV
ncbi:MAG: bifunctional (p)ppGpp synthetase/guanosine-3',5'-bis(diphosphate) 3'-pyrophosphohydrolase [Eubacterium sp.]|jgi:GTP pyrophosphokinase|nr:bifunctional (p)ppGpp synthetase/guanosine-3',5'-bis(diphosphate) 3'-pyrophosphohydrolase [Eubacterium sp.]MCH4047644.1 bifunctional (p)ppGpp synthetase/guanosine-3',5'-bis(diphosphate) 3'-pyrophosphohydrolase [Eubacterium sp.]MCH4078416.1 bifunctional (p)ppGpp synthetase/guanosine-3',5'-bis(diphosphate) 3'-pyrophosphohydrolase [Eubacterium sp.]MCH4109560.1 bifunctional (p)ppGpp synthetase/guanosine-3',5'-bis(diphosphate) 3'-pyrophosphohydrolase [Eubacterium sp.]MCI1306656.1 bifunctional (p)